MTLEEFLDLMNFTSEELLQKLTGERKELEETSSDNEEDSIPSTKRRKLE